MIYNLLIGTCLVLILWVLMIMLAVFEKVLSSRIEQSNEPKSSTFLYELNEKVVQVRQLKNLVLAVSILILTGFTLYLLFNNTPVQGFVMLWLNLIIRWIHVVAGTMWIGASFYFIFLENNLNRTVNIRDELAGNLWAIHGGGFYFLEKYKLAPKQIPKNLHWFKYEAYFTWLSGFSLLCVVYYMDAKSFLIDPQRADISATLAILIGVGTLILGWIIYDQLCKSVIAKNQTVFAVIGFLLLVVISYFLTQFLNSRAAYIHVGALIGTLMAWNVYFVIIPSQKSLVKAAITGQPLDPSLGKKAGERSLHNNYLTLPVIFIMISNHFPNTFGHEYHWLILAVLILASAGIKHFWNLYERGIKTQLVLPLSIILLISLAMVTSPSMDQSGENLPKVTIDQVQTVFALRCAQCHSSNPTDELWKTAPNGVIFDTPQQMQAMKDKIMLRTVQTNSMPQGNKTNMTKAERDLIKAWILQGAKIEDP